MLYKNKHKITCDLMELLEKGMWTKRRVQREVKVKPYREEAGEQRLKVGKTRADGRTMEFGVFSYRFTLQDTRLTLHHPRAIKSSHLIYSHSSVPLSPQTRKVRTFKCIVR